MQFVKTDTWTDINYYINYDFSRLDYMLLYFFSTYFWFFKNEHLFLETNTYFYTVIFFKRPLNI